MADTRTRIINLPEATTLDPSMNFVEDSADGSGTRRVTYDTLKGVINQEGAVNLAPAYSNAATYNVGDLCTYQGRLYTCNTQISTAEDWTAAHWTLTNMASDLYQLKSDINNCVMFEHPVEVEHTDTHNYLFNNDTMTATSLSGFSYTIVPALEGETYNVSGYGSSVYSPVFASDSEALLTFDLETNATAPSGTTRLIVNGRPSMGLDIEIRKIVTTEKSEALFKRIDDLEEGVLSSKTIGVSLSNNGICRIFQKNYDDGYDFETEIIKKSGNDLPDIDGFYRVTNSSDVVLNESNGTEVAIVSSSTDFLSPSTVYAVNNMNGDFPDLTSGKLTGGWHRYNSSTTTGTPTARNISYKVFCDGVEVTTDNPMRGNKVVVDIVNRLQASNTEKSDGTGREVVEQHFRLVFGQDFGCKVYGEITALEDVLYATYYGISTLNIANVPVRFIGCRTNRQGNTPSEVVRCGDKYCIGTQQVSDADTYEIGFDPTIDLGTQFANKWSNSCTMSSGKAYMVLIFATNQNDMLALSANDKVYWQGYYNCYSTVN